jgi:hypothetical protein
MQPVFKVGQKVAVNLGGCAENRTVGVVRSIRELPSLTTYELELPGYGRTSGIEVFYMAEALTPVS